MVPVDNDNIPVNLLGPERFARRRLVSPPTTREGPAMAIRSRFIVRGTSRVCPPGFRNVGGQCVAQDEIGNRVSLRQVRGVSRGSPGLLQQAIESGRVRELVRPIVRVEPIRDRPAPIIDQPAPVRLQKDLFTARTSQFLDLNRDGIDDRDVVQPIEKRVMPRKTQDFCPSCERQAPKPKEMFDSRPPLLDLSPQEAKRGGKNILTGVALFVAAIVGLKVAKVL